MASRKRTRRKAKPVDMKTIKRAKDRLTRKVINAPGVTGVAVGAKPSGKPCLNVYVSGRTPSGLPKSCLGLDVVVEKTGSFKRH